MKVYHNIEHLQKSQNTTILRDVSIMGDVQITNSAFSSSGTQRERPRITNSEMFLTP